MISQLFTQDTFKILTLFSLSPGSRFKRNELKGKAIFNNVPLDKALNRLVNSGLVKREGNYYSLNFENDYTKGFINICAKQHRQVRRLPLRICFLLSDIVLQASSLKGVELYLFGSYAKLIYTEKSDIDLAVLTARHDSREILSKVVEKAGKAYGKVVEPHFFNKEDFYRNKKDPLIAEILKNGIRLV